MKRTTTLLRTLLLTVVSFSFTTHVDAQTFTNPLPIPYLMNGNNFSIDITPGSHNFDPTGFLDSVNLNVDLPTYCYNETGNTGMSYLGPTLIFEKGDSMFLDITNHLPGGKNTTVHWHGLNIPARMDGGPHQVIKNDSTWTPKFAIYDPVQTIWYHTHLMDETTDQVIRGLAGMILIKDNLDPLEAVLPHSYGENDFPIIIQEKNFVWDTLTTPPTATALVAGEKPGNGPYTLVNGVVGGVLHVAPEMTRLRILNGSPRKMFHIGLSTELNNPTNFADMHMVATGGGYTDVPYSVDSTLMSIGDRREFVIDFSLYPDGDTVYMINLSVPADANYGKTSGRALMAFVVDDALFPTDPIVSIPPVLDAAYALAPGPIFRTREKVLQGLPMPPGGGTMWVIDGTGMDMMVINDTLLVNTKEEWEIVNATIQAHPFHIHKTQFQITEYTGRMGASEDFTTYTYPNLPAELLGWKDVQLIRAGATMKFIARYDSFPSPLMPKYGYMYHCHILTHEDTAMMHQFVVVDSATFYSALISGIDVEELMVYPNPAEGSLSFKGDYNDAGVLRLYDLTGNILREIEVTSLSSTTISVADLPRGFLILEFVSGEKRYVQKVSLK